MSKQTEALKLALEALEYWHVRDEFSTQTSKAITAIREALAEQPAQQQNQNYNICPTCGGMASDPIVPPSAWHQEPVAWILKPTMELLWPYEIDAKDPSKSKAYKPLYTSPPASKPWVGLTDKEKKEIYRLSVYVEGAISLTEAKLREKNA